MHYNYELLMHNRQIGQTSREADFNMLSNRFCRGPQCCPFRNGNIFVYHATPLRALHHHHSDDCQASFCIFILTAIHQFLYGINVHHSQHFIPLFQNSISNFDMNFKSIAMTLGLEMMSISVMRHPRGKFGVITSGARFKYETHELRPSSIYHDYANQIEPRIVCSTQTFRGVKLKNKILGGAISKNSQHTFKTFGTVTIFLTVWIKNQYNPLVITLIEPTLGQRIT